MVFYALFKDCHGRQKVPCAYKFLAFVEGIIAQNHLVGKRYAINIETEKTTFLGGVNIKTRYHHHSRFCRYGRVAENLISVWDGSIIQLDKLEFGGQWPLTMRARLACIRYFPNPLGIVTADQLDKLEFDGVIWIGNIGNHRPH